MARIGPALLAAFLLLPGAARAADGPAGSWKFTLPRSNLNVLMRLEEKNGKWSAQYLGSNVADLPKVTRVELQPLAAQARRVSDALDLIGAPLPDDDKKALADARDVAAIQAVLDKHCLAGVTIRAGGEPALTVVAAATTQAQATAPRPVRRRRGRTPR